MTGAVSGGSIRRSKGREIDPRGDNRPKNASFLRFRERAGGHARSALLVERETRAWAVGIVEKIDPRTHS